MEPDAFELPDGTQARNDHPDVAIKSIAISLKRIADALSYQPDGKPASEKTLFSFVRDAAR